MEKIKQLRTQLEAAKALADELAAENPQCPSALAARGRLNGVTDMLDSLERELASELK